MKLHIGQTFNFKSHSYQVRSQLGSGAVSDVYLAVLTGADAPAEVAIKVVHDQASSESPQAQGARMEAEVLTILNRMEDRRWAGQANPIARLNHAQQTSSTRRIVGLLDSGLDADGRMLQIQELAPPAFRRLPVKTIDDEQALIGVAEAVARAIELAHAQGFALKDFEPRGEKVDRIRVDWNAPKNVKVIDWNITAGPNATTAEKASDLLYLGGHLYYFFIGEHTELTGRAPSDLGLGIAGWSVLHEGSRQIVRRLLSRRYQSAREVRDDLSWWHTTMALRSAGDLERRIKLAGERADRKLAVTDLALRLEIGPAERERFEQIRAQARRDLDRADRVQLDQGVVNLRTGLYRKAVEEFERNLRDPQLAPELAQQARLYRLQALFAIWIRGQDLGRNLSENPVWQLVNRAVEDMQHQQWQAAIEALHDAGEKLPAPSAELQLLQGLAQAGLSVSQYGQQQVLLRGGPQSLQELEQWIKDEHKRQAELEPVVEQLRHAANELAPHEPFYTTFYRNAHAYLEKRKQQLSAYTQVERCLRDAAARRQQADALLTQPTLWLESAPADSDPLAAYGSVDESLVEALAAATEARQYATDTAEQSQLLPDIQSQIDKVHAIRANLERLPTIAQLIRVGEYEQARDLCEQALEHLPSYVPVNVLRTVAQTGVEWQSRVQAYIDQAREAIRQRAFEAAGAQLSKTLGLQRQQLVAAADRATLPDLADNLIFDLHDEGEAQRLTEVIHTIEDVRQRVLQAYDRDHDKVIGDLEGLRREIASFGYGLSDDEGARLDEARQGQQRIQSALASLAQARGQLGAEAPARAEALRRTFEYLSGDPTPRAHELREAAAEEWVRLCKNERAFELVYQLLKQGAALLSDTSQAKQLRDLYEQAVPAAYVSDRLPSDGSVTQAWIAGAERTKILADLVPTLQQLSGIVDQTALIALRLSLPTWYARLKAALGAWLNETYARAGNLAKQGEFTAAHKLMREAWQIGPDTLQSLLPEASGSIQSLIGALEQRQQLEQQLQQIIGQLATGTLTFGDAPERLPKLPQEHEYVSLDDLRIFMAGLAKLKSLISTPVPQAIDAQWLYQLYNRHEDIAQVDELQLRTFAPAHELHKPLERLGDATSQEAIDDARTVCDKLSRYTTFDQTNQRGFSQLFWTVAWWQAATADRHPSASALAERALAQVRASFYGVAKRVRDDLLRAASTADIEYVKAALEQIIEYNELFTTKPGALILPAYATPATQTPPFDEDMLEDWRTIVEVFAHSAAAPLPDHQPEQYSAVNLATTISALQTLSHRLQQLGDLVLPALFPNEHSPNTRLTELDREANDLIDWASAIRQAHTQYRQAHPINTLQLLYQSRARAHQIPQTWPLDNLRANIDCNHRAVERQARVILTDRVQAILELEDPKHATSTLSAELIERATSDQLAYSLKRAILDCIKQPNTAFETSTPELNAQRQKLRWQIVHEAVTNWLGSSEAARPKEQPGLG